MECQKKIKGYLTGQQHQLTQRKFKGLECDFFKSNNPMLTLQQRKWLLLKHLLNSADTLAPVAPHQ
jgi:hypothetical protein